MIDFKVQQEKIYNFIVDNYNNYLPAYLQNPIYTKEFLDMDKFKNNFTVFIDFAQITFPQSNYEDDCEEVERLNLTIYLVHRNNTSETLQENNLDSSYAFYKLIKDKPDLIFVQEITIDSIDFYNWAEGNKYLVVSEFTLSMTI
jgi:hypothetical protein